MHIQGEKNNEALVLLSYLFTQPKIHGKKNPDFGLTNNKMMKGIFVHTVHWPFTEWKTIKRIAITE